MKELIKQPMDGPPSTTWVVHLLGRSGDNIGYLHASRSQASYERTACFPATFEPGKLYRLSSSGLAIFSHLCEATKKVYVNRHFNAFIDGRYEMSVLRSLLLERRIDDYNTRSASVVSISPKFLLLSMRRNPGAYASFLTESGAQIDVIVEEVVNHGMGVLLACAPVHKLPGGLFKNSRIECVSQVHRTPMVTEILESVAKKHRPITDRNLLNRLYGEVGAYSQHKVNESHVRLHSKDGRSLLLAPDQSEAVQRYVDEVSDCPGLVLEGVACTGKALTLAALASSYCALDGLQLILSPDPESLRDIACTLSSQHLGNKRIVNIAELEPGSPFTLFDSNLNSKQLKHLVRLSSRLARASGRRARTLRRLQRRAHAAAIAALGPQDVIIATMEQAFYWLLRPKNPYQPCPIQEQLERSVTRIIIQDADDVTEAELNALVLIYARPGTKIVSVGDDVRSVLHQPCCSALELMKLKRNLPVIKLTQRYEEECGWEEEPSLDLRELLKGAGELAEWKQDCNQVFISLAGSTVVPSGKSYICDEEIEALTWTVELLRGAGYDNQQVLILPFAEAQRRLAMTRLPTDDYEVKMVDEAQGLESKIVIALTAADDSSTMGELELEKRCNIAVSAHADALIVLGRDDLCTTSGWKQLLQRGYFNKVKYSRK